MGMVWHLDFPFCPVLHAPPDSAHSFVADERRYFLRHPHSLPQRLDSLHRASQNLSRTLDRQRTGRRHSHSRRLYSDLFPTHGRRFTRRSGPDWLHSVTRVVLVGRFRSLPRKKRVESGTLFSCLPLPDGPPAEYPSRPCRLPPTTGFHLDNGGPFRSLACPGLA